MAEAETVHTCRRRVSGPRVNGVRVDPLSRVNLADAIASFLECGRSHVVHFLPADPTIHAQDDALYREVLNGGDLNVPDGMSVVWALRLQGARSDRLAGADALLLLAGWGVERGARHFLYGGRPEVVARLHDRLQEAFPGIRVAGVESPPFRPLADADLRQAAARIGEAGTELLWVGLGTPKQDLVAERLRALNAAPVVLCVGAAFDFVSGAVARAPAWMQRAGLEWLYRLRAEPTRLWRRYLVGNPRFVWGVTRDVLSGRRR